ncbi:helix-turn-helix domain-containing protein [Kitasatospora aureofaciens]|uniref:TetR/AcrR family transcriptional regulator n=1 Tax=Kitasatospora aureofaciens TaxID=1894 RepID=UPI00052597F1|nr:TetR/AcrR family transcriptional regulator [Kitasatospora aureofaciens]HJD81893.1 TetR/AcrR family transcriptional regulator; helix-turn-helix transcriptional regulator [Kitasatospora aureofaciens]
MSSSNATAGAPRSTDDAILDAAADLIVHLGVRRTQLAEIARRAGVSRPTVYRRWPDVQAVIGALLTREILSTLEGTSLEVHDRETFVDRVVEVAVRLRDHPVLGALLHSDDSDLLLRYVVERLGASQRGLLEALRTGIEQGQAVGSIRAGEPTELAAMVLLITQSTVQSHRMVASLLPEAAWRRELARALNGYLAP